MTDRLSSSRGNRSSDHSSRRNARDQHPIMWSQLSDRQNREADPQASASSGLDNGKQRGEYREQRQRNYIHDNELQLRFNVSLSEMESYLKTNDFNKEEQQEILEMYKQSFQKLTKKRKTRNMDGK
jgi:hypothetical protein